MPDVILTYMTAAETVAYSREYGGAAPTLPDTGELLTVSSVYPWGLSTTAPGWLVVLEYRMSGSVSGGTGVSYSCGATPLFLSGTNTWGQDKISQSGANYVPTLSDSYGPTVPVASTPNAVTNVGSVVLVGLRRTDGKYDVSAVSCGRFLTSPVMYGFSKEYRSAVATGATYVGTIGGGALGTSGSYTGSVSVQESFAAYAGASVLTSAQASYYMSRVSSLATSTAVANLASISSSLAADLPQSLDATALGFADMKNSGDYDSFIGRVYAQMRGLTEQLRGLFWFLDPWKG